MFNLKWLNNYRQPAHNLKDSRIYLLQYIKSHPSDEFSLFNFHYYSMPDEFEKLHNVKVFEEIADLDKIAKPHQNYYIVYFDEKGGYCQWLPGRFKEKHKNAMQYFKQFPKFKIIRGNYKNEFGGQGPATNPKVVIREFK